MITMAAFKPRERPFRDADFKPDWDEDNDECIAYTLDSSRYENGINLV